MSIAVSLLEPQALLVVFLSPKRPLLAVWPIPFSLFFYLKKRDNEYFLETLSNDLQIFFIRVKTHTIIGGLMKNETLVEFIREKYYEQKMSAEYELQLTKIIELENKFTKDFSKDKWRIL